MMKWTSKTVPLWLSSMLGFGLVSFGVAQEFSYFDGQWAHATSDITPHAGVTFGRLDNGLRYAIMPHANPAGRVSVYLVVQAGSLMEEDRDLGSAHYVEHMAFNGSKHFAPGELIPFFQREGMRFGADTNAHTGSLETVYKLNLASTDQARLDEALLMLRDVADGLTLSPQEVAQELGVIKAEMRARDSLSYQNALKVRAFLYPNSRLNRSIIGTHETLDRVTPESLRAFYKTWYVPSRMVVVVVGDVNPQRVVAGIEAQFSSLPAQTHLPFVEAFGDTLEKGTAYLGLTHPEPTVSLQWIGLFEPYRHEPTQARELEGLLDTLGTLIVNRRLSALREKDPTLWERARFSIARREARMPSTQLIVITTPEREEEALRRMREILLSVQTQPATASEWQWAKARLKTILQDRALTEKSLTNADYAKSLAQSVIEHEVFTTPQDDLVRFEAQDPLLTLEAVNARLRESVLAPATRMIVTSQKPRDKEEIQKRWALAAPRHATAPVSMAKKPFPYLSPWPDAVKLDWKALPLAYQAAGMTLWHTTTPTGWDVWMMPSKLEKNVVRASLYFGMGLNGVEANTVPAARLAQQWLGLSGVGNLGPLGTRDTLTSAGIQVRENVLARYSVIAGRSTHDKLDLLLEALRTQYEDPHLDTQAHPSLRASLALSEASQDKTVHSLVNTYRDHVLTGSRALTAPLTVKDVDALTETRALTILREARQSGKHVILVVGDLGEADRARVARWASALPAVRQTSLGTVQGARVPLGSRFEYVAQEETLPKWHLSARWSVPLPREPEARKREEVTYQLLAALVRERLRLKLREEASLTYSPQARFSSAWVGTDPRTGPYEGWLTVTVEGQPQDARQLETLMEGVMDELVKSPPTEDELIRLKATHLSQLKVLPQNLGVLERMLVLDLMRGSNELAYMDSQDAWVNAVVEGDVVLSAQRLFSRPSARFIVQTQSQATP